MPPPPAPSGAASLPVRTLKESSTNQTILVPMSGSLMNLKLNSNSDTASDIKAGQHAGQPTGQPEVQHAGQPDGNLIPVSTKLLQTGGEQVKTEINSLPFPERPEEIFHNNLPQTLPKENFKKCPIKVSKLQERRRKQQQQPVTNNNNNNNNLVVVPLAVDQRCCPELPNQLQNGELID